MKLFLIAILFTSCSASKVIDTGKLVTSEHDGNRYTITVLGSDSCTKYWGTWKAPCFYCEGYKVPERWEVRETRNGFSVKPVK